MAPVKDDDAASGIYTYDGSFASGAQDTHVSNVTNDGSISFAAKVAAENEKVAQEFGLPLGVYGFKGQRQPRGDDGDDDGEVADSTTDCELASTFSGVYEMDDSSLVRNVSADAILGDQERAEVGEKNRSVGHSESNGDDTRGTLGLIGDYAVPFAKGSRGGSQSQDGSNKTPPGGFMDTLMRTMVRMGLGWEANRPSTPETMEKTGSPTGSREEEVSVVPSVSILSFDGPEANTTTSASRAPLFKGRSIQRNYPTRSSATGTTQDKPPLLNPARLIAVCTCVVLFSVALAVGGYIAYDRRGDSDSDGASAIRSNNDDFRDALTSSTAANPTVTTPAEKLPCGVDSLSAVFDINGNEFDCIWFSLRSAPYKDVMCETRPDIADACRETCGGKCDGAATPATPGNPGTTSSTTSAASVTSTSGTKEQAAVVSTPSPVTTAPTGSPVAAPTPSPSPAPTAWPTGAPFAAPTWAPFAAPTWAPIAAPTSVPFTAPTSAPFTAPTRAPIPAPTAAPFAAPTSAPVRQPTPLPTRLPAVAPVDVPTSAPQSSSQCPPDSSGFIPDSTTTCEEFTAFHPDFRRQRCQPGWPVYTFCYATCGNCDST